MSHILLVGGAGFIGSNVVSELCRRGHKDIIVLEPEFAIVSRVKHLPIRILRGNISNVDQIRSILTNEGIDTVVHLVSTIVPGSDFDAFKNEFSSVVFPTIQLLELCCKLKIKFVFFSSGGTVYGERKNVLSPFRETDNMAPISFYGWSKQMMEDSIQYMHRTQQLRYVIIRPSNPYGSGQNLHGKQGLIAVALGKILNGEPIQIWGDGSVVRDYIYIDDLARAVCDIISNDSIENMVLNIGSGVGYSVNDIICMIQEIVLKKAKIEYVSSRQSDVSSMILNIDKLCGLIDFHPIDIREGIARFYQEVKNGR